MYGVSTVAVRGRVLVYPHGSERGSCRAFETVLLIEEGYRPSRQLPFMEMSSWLQIHQNQHQHAISLMFALWMGYTSAHRI